MAVFEFLVELVRAAGVGDPAVEADQTEGEIFGHHLADSQLLMDNLGLGVMQEVENHLHKLSRNVRICHDILLTQQKGGQLQQLPYVLLPDNHEVVLLDGEKRRVVLANQRQQQLRQIVDHFSRFLL